MSGVREEPARHAGEFFLVSGVVAKVWPKIQSPAISDEERSPRRNVDLPIGTRNAQVGSRLLGISTL